MARLALTIAACAMLAIAPAAARADAAPEPIGKIAILVPDSAYVTLTEYGQPKTYRVRDDCKITLDGQPAKLSDLKAGHYVLSLQTKEQTDPPELTEFVLVTHSAVQPYSRPLVSPTPLPGASPAPQPSHSPVPGPNQNPPPRKRRLMRFHTGTAYDGAVNRVEMTDETWEEVCAALPPWKGKYDAEMKGCSQKKAALDQAALKETDPEKRKEALAAARNFKMPGQLESYISLRAALAGLLTEAQLLKADEFAVERLAGSPEQFARQTVNQLEKPAGGFTPEQRTRMEAAFKSARERAAKMPLATLIAEQWRIGTQAVTEIRDTIFTDAQREALRKSRGGPATRPH